LKGSGSLRRRDSIKLVLVLGHEEELIQVLGHEAEHVLAHEEELLQIFAYKSSGRGRR
jgi:hypothetical protein